MGGTPVNHQLKQLLKDGKGNTVTDRRDINAQSKSFYESLYTSEAGDGELVENFFSKLEMPSLAESDKSELERNIILTVINSAI